MSNKTIFPPIDFPAISREDLRILVDAAPHVVSAYNKEIVAYDKEGLPEQSWCHLAVMRDCLGKCMPHHKSAEFTGLVLHWLFQCREFWKKPAYVQKMEQVNSELTKELEKHREYIAWQKKHLQSEKFRQDTTIQVNDLLHAMEQHGV